MAIRKYIDVFIEDKSYPGHPARWQQFVNIQTGEEIDERDLVGSKIHATFIDSFGRMCMTLENPAQ